MYNITYKTEEDTFNFETPAKHPFDAYRLFQENVLKVFKKVEIISLNKERYEIRLF